MKKAFTLIELLVVIAIIAILAAILFPVFAQAKLAAKKTVSISNLKQMALGLKMYEGDYDDTIPLAQYCGQLNNADSLITWENEIYPYMKSGENVVVNADGTGNGSPDRDVSSGIWLDPGAPDNQSFAYGIHFHLAPDNWGATCAFPGNGTVQSGVSETVEPNPSDTIFVMTKGRTESDPTVATDQWGWVYYIADEYGWTNGYVAQGATINGNTVTGGTDELANLHGNCDGASAAGLGEAWAGCGMLPRYRYTNTCPNAFTDGHAKALPKGQLTYWKNVYVPGLNALY
jgi:prepilin-type N-terminal cleavage/methylation domain-containing protein